MFVLFSVARRSLLGIVCLALLGVSAQAESHLPLVTALTPLTAGIIKGRPVDDSDKTLDSGRFATGMLIHESGEKKGRIGTATAVCRNVVITAGHVAGPNPEQTAAFVMTKNAKERNKKRFDALVVDKFCFRKNLHKMPDKLEGYADDICLLKLNHTFKPEEDGFKIPKIYSPKGKKLDLAANEQFLALGYGLDDRRGLTDARFRREGIRREGTIGGKEILAGKLMFTVPGKTGQMTAPGDSGAPIYRMDSKGNPIGMVGIHVAGKGAKADGHVALLEPHRVEIEKKMKEWCAEHQVHGL